MLRAGIGKPKCGIDLHDPFAKILTMAFDTFPWLRWLPHPRLPEGGEPFKNRWLALLAISMGVFLIALDVTIVGVTGPKLAEALSASATQIQWAFDSYTLVLAGFVILGGGLAERFGRKGWVQLGMFVFAIGSSISAFAPSVGILIAGRVVSGLGAAVVFPACLSIVSVLFEPVERRRAIGMFASISAFGLAGGPLAAGLLIEHFWWGASFLVVVPIALISIVAIAFTVPPSRQTKQGPLDTFGAILSILSLGGIVFGVIEGPVRGWGNWQVLLSFAIGILSSWAFIRWELRSSAPLFDLRVFEDPRVVGGALAMATVYFTFNSFQLLLPQYLGYVLNYSSLHTGLIMLPFGLGLVILSPRSSPLVERHGQRGMLLFSLAFMTLGILTMSLLPVWGGIPNILTGASIYSIGFGLIVAPATSIVMVAIPKEKAGDGSAVNMVSRQIGGAIGVALTGAVASIIYRRGLSLEAFSLDDGQSARVEQSLSGVIAIQGEIPPAAAEKLDAMADAAMIQGVSAAMLVCACVTLSVGVISFFALGGRKDSSDQQPA